MAKMKLAHARFLQTAPDEFERLLERLANARDNTDPYVIQRHKEKYYLEDIPAEAWPHITSALIDYWHNETIDLLNKIDDLDVSTTDERERLAEALAGNDDNGDEE